MLKELGEYEAWRASSRVFQLVLLVTLVLWLPLTAVRLLMTDAYLGIEYTRAGFPDDSFGFSLEDRMYYGSLAVEFLVSGHDEKFLSELTFESGVSVYNEREVRHMVDVRNVVGVVFVFWYSLSVLLIVVSLYLYMTTRNFLVQAFIQGGLTTLGLIGGLVFLTAFSWNTFFTQFHQLFFEPGTWRFEYSDTLIRLFPEQFWFDSAIAIGALTTTGAVVFIIAGWLLGLCIHRHAATTQQ